MEGEEDSVMVTHKQTPGKNQVTISVTRHPCMRDQYMQMLLHVNVDFDDDLLMDTMSLLNA